MKVFRRIKRSFALVVALFMILSIIPMEPTYAEDIVQRKVINIVVDGLSDSMYEEIKARGVETPNLDSLIANGSRLREVETVIPAYGGSQAVALTGAATDTNRFLYRYYDGTTNSVISDTNISFKMEAQTIFEKLIEDNTGIRVLASGWQVADKTIDGRGVFSTGNEDYILKEYSRGDKLVSIDTIANDIITAINSENTPEFITAYSNDIKMAGWGGTDSSINSKLDDIVRLIDTKVGEVVQALKDTGKFEDTTIILNSLAPIYTIGSKITTSNLASKITVATGVKSVESGGGAIPEDAKVVVIKQYIMAYAQLYFTDAATEEDKTKVLEYLNDKTSEIGKDIETIYYYEDLGLSSDYCDYLINPIEGKSFSAAGSGVYRTDDLHLKEVFCIVSGNDIENGSGVKGDLSIKDIVPTICSILGVNPPNNNEGRVWTFEQVSSAPVITITYPSNNLTVYKEVINLTGTVNISSIVKVNGIEVDVTGNKFSTDVTLKKGKNDILIEATNYDGKTSSSVVSVNYVVKPEIPDGNVIVYINWDGFANYYVELAEAQGRIPTLSNIKENEGVYFSNAYTGIPSITNPMQAAISSGTTSKYTGNSYRHFDKRQNKVIQEPISRRNEAETLAESVKRQGLNSISINQFAFEDRGNIIGDELNPYVNADVGANGYSDAVARFDTAIKLVTELEAGGIKLDKLPRFISLYMDDLDGVGHNEVETYGLPIAKTEEGRKENILDRLEIMDTKLGEFIQACKDAGIYDKMSFVLTADHGMANFGAQNSLGDDSTKSKLLDLMSAIESLGEGYKCEFLHPSQIAVPSEGTDIAIVTVGLQAQISYVGEFNDEIIAEKNTKILEVLKVKNYIGEVMLPNEIESRGVSKGFADLIVSPKTPYHFHGPTVTGLTARGQHDSLEDEAQHIGSFMWGNGVKKGEVYTEKIYNTDFAATMSELLGLNYPLDSTGNIIYGALNTPKIKDEYIQAIEAESATVNGAANKYFDENASNGMAITGINSEGSFVEFINVPEATKMEVNYSAENDGKLVLYVNDKIVRDIYFPETETENKYEGKTINIDLNKGDSVKFVFESRRGSAKVNLDKIDFYNNEEQVEDTIKTGDPFTVVMTPNGDTENSMGFAWYTDKDIKGTVVQVVEAKCEESDFSNATNFNGICTTIGVKLNGDNVVYESHKVIANNLKPGTKYFYKVGDGTTWSEVGSFTTSSQGDFSFVYLTDSQGKNEGDYDVWSETLEAAISKFEDSKFLVMAGDMVDAGLNVPNNEQEWIHYFEKAKKSLLNLPIAPVIGNHEGRNNTGFNNHFNLPTISGVMATPDNSVYSFDYNDVHFAMLNTEMTESAEMFQPQIDWLKRDMIATDKKWRIVVLHKPMYSTSSHIKDKDIVEIIKPMLEPVIDELGIDLVLQGHDHIYARTHQIYNGHVTNDKVVDGKVTNPKGTMYIVNNTSGFKYYDQHQDAQLQYFEKTGQPNEQVYSGIKVSGNELRVESYLLNSDTLYDSYAIERTDVAPNKVEDFMLSETKDGNIKLTWTGVKDAKEYVIYEIDNKIGQNWSKRIDKNEEGNSYEITLDIKYSNEYRFAIKTVMGRSYSEAVEAITEEIKCLIEDIDKIPAKIELKHKELVYSLVDRYNNLSENHKILVVNYNKLEEAVNKIKDLEGETEKPGNGGGNEENNQENGGPSEGGDGNVDETVDSNGDSSKGDNLPQTGSDISSSTVLIIALFIVASGYFIVNKKNIA